MNALRTLDRFIAGFCKIGCVTMLAALFLLLAASVILRLLPLFTISGYDEIVELLFIWIVMLATVSLWREGMLYRVEVLDTMLPPRGRLVMAVLINLLMFGFAAMMVWYGWAFAAAAGETTPFLRLDKIYWYTAIPLCSALMAVYSLVWLWRILWLGEDPHRESNLLS
ncbi:TRAP transporter small permease [Szabonella alba]|uniref:TRAP transporter small permease protein n=1 Tax=Szabonella alba TaxID=2804194 RepID=A0A8K0VAT2_9RHOB|nr:TRAP transporter small permease [Szabonella alba]MBL4918503.1 TRAP transporter small permease [Szabonella alba]